MQDAMTALRENSMVFLVLLVVRIQSALWYVIADCDETFNYWEPLHYLLKGKGFQTWEYSPEFALRSYSYLWLFALPAKILGLFVENSVLLFYLVRCILSVTCALLEYRLYKVFNRKFGSAVSNMWLVFQLCNAGMYVASAALLPSSFAMYITLATLAAWLNDDIRRGIALTALSGLIGWPFAVIVSVPFVLEVLFKRKRVAFFIKNSLLFGCLFGIPIVLIDSVYYGTFTVAAWNLIRYNVFTSHGPDLYGVEPMIFYVKNLFLNHNFTLIFSVSIPFVLALAASVGIKNAKSVLSPLQGLWVMSPLFLWLAVFMFQPHKEERFLFPIYPLFSLGGALLLDQLFVSTRTFLGPKKSVFPIVALSFALFGSAALVGLSRILAVSMFYRAPVTILNDLPPADFETNVCYGQEWYRFPGSFFLPPNYRARFIESNFHGMLPAYFQETENGTQVVHDYFNDQNKGHPHMLFNRSQCDYLVVMDENMWYEDVKSEKDFSADEDLWSLVQSTKFLHVTKSPQLARSYYLPFMSYRYLMFGRYNLLQRIKVE